MHRENMKKKRREMEQASLDAASDLLDTDSNATFAMVRIRAGGFAGDMRHAPLFLGTLTLTRPGTSCGNGAATNQKANLADFRPMISVIAFNIVQILLVFDRFCIRFCSRSIRHTVVYCLLLCVCFRNRVPRADRCDMLKLPRLPSGGKLKPCQLQLPLPPNL